MLNVVVDTNVIISAALSPEGNAAKILDLIADNEEIQLFYSTEILLEYKQILSRKRLNIDLKKQAAYLEVIKNTGHQLEPLASDVSLPDESDRTFYDTARQANAILITGNKKHYPDEKRIMSPAEFLQWLSRVTLS